MKDPKLIYVEWYDAISNSNGWRNKDEALEWGEKNNWLVKESGFLIKQTKDYILLSNNIVFSDNGLLYGIVKKIPTRWVKKKVELTIP